LIITIPIPSNATNLDYLLLSRVPLTLCICMWPWS